MANRSDFFSAKLPRAMKRSLAMGRTYGWIPDAQTYGSIKKRLISAHADHVSFKMKRHTTENRDASDVE